MTKKTRFRWWMRKSYVDMTFSNYIMGKNIWQAPTCVEKTFGPAIRRNEYTISLFVSKNDIATYLNEQLNDGGEVLDAKGEINDTALSITYAPKYTIVHIATGRTWEVFPTKIYLRNEEVYIAYSYKRKK